MQSNRKNATMTAGLVAALLAVGPGRSAGQEAGPRQSEAPALITLAVPAEAKVFFGGDTTTQTGRERVYTSPYLEPGKTYHYNVLVRWEVNGKVAERTRKVKV